MPESLTQREKEVLRLVASGKSSIEIATKLEITQSTVKFHRKNLLKKSGANNVAQLIQWASKHKLV